MWITFGTCIHDHYSTCTILILTVVSISNRWTVATLGFKDGCFGQPTRGNNQGCGILPMHPKSDNGCRLKLARIPASPRTIKNSHFKNKKYSRLQSSLVFLYKNIVPYLVSLLPFCTFEHRQQQTQHYYTLLILDFDLSNCHCHCHLPLDNFVYYACSINRATPPPPPISYAVGYSQLVLPLSW
jgi:hypothetical protein